MKFYIWTIGCQMNEADSRHLSEELLRAGYTPCDDLRQADLVVLNTCVVRQQAEDRVWGQLRELQRWKQRRPDLRIALMGCLVGHRPAQRDRLRQQLPFVDYFLPPSDFSELLNDLGDGVGACSTVQEATAHSIGANRDGPTLPAPVSANVPAVLGCSHTCTYCIIPYRRGAERSRDPEQILAEIQNLIARGTREVVLLGQIVDRYGYDLPNGPDLAGLLAHVAQLEGLRRVRFLTSHPSYVTDRLIETVAAHPKICPQFELPAQAGDDTILARMRRRYTAAEYLATVERIRRVLPHAAIHSDFIVGFPGETDEQFERTCQLVREVRFDKLHIARYSPRPDTYAQRHYPDDVPADVKEERRRRLESVQREIQSELNRRWLGQVVQVLVDGFDERRRRWRGRTELDRLVFFEDPRPRLGQLVPVRITWTGPYSLLGEPVDHAPQSRLERLAVSPPNG
jgi:tRNA-2-methylthio-N6-dimethylallyladenosine synthase